MFIGMRSLCCPQDKPGNGLFLSNCKMHVSVTQEFAWQEMSVPLVSWTTYLRA